MTAPSCKQPTMTDQPTLTYYSTYSFPQHLPPSSIDFYLPSPQHQSRKTPISHSIHFTGFPSIYNMEEEIAILTVFDSSLTNNIKSIIRNTLDFSVPTSTNTPPHIPTAKKIDLTPITGFPRYCLIGSCPFHNKKQDLFADTSTELQQAQSQGIHLHHHLLSTLNTSTLSSIGWHQCCDTCPAIYLNQFHLDTHRARFIAYHIVQTSTTSSTTTTASPSRTGAFASLYLICPKHNKQDLGNLILNSPSANRMTLFATVQAWYNSNSIQDNAPTVTPNMTNEPCLHNSILLPN
jgi:hypothetical protein